jgi:hypothetical protein
VHVIVLVSFVPFASERFITTDVPASTKHDAPVAVNPRISVGRSIDDEAYAIEVEATENLNIG